MAAEKITTEIVTAEKRRVPGRPRRRSILFGRLDLLFATLCLGVTSQAASRPVSFSRPSDFADTQVATNVPINRVRFDVRSLSVRFRFLRSENAAQEVQFGFDRDGDGVLARDETDVMLGCRGGRFFVENVRAWDRRMDALPEAPSDAERTSRTTGRSATSAMNRSRWS